MISKEKMEKALSRFNFYSYINWNQLPLNEQEELEKHFEPIRIKRKAMLYKQNTYPNGVYILKKGMMKVYQSNKDGSKQILFIYTPGEVFGHRPIISNEYHPFTIAALDDCELNFIPRKYFLELMHRSVSLSNQLLINLSLEFTVLINRINFFAQKGIKERTALALLILNEKFKPENVLGHSEIKLTRIDLSDFIGTSPETLTRTLNSFKDKNLMRVSGKRIYLLDTEQLFMISSID